MKHYESLYVAAVAFFFLWTLVFSPNADAQPFGPRQHTPHAFRAQGPGGFYPRPGLRINVLPKEYLTLHIGALTYFFLQGAFYRPILDGYVVVPAPLGARIPSLPAGAVHVRSGDLTGYTYAGVYYQKMRDGYVVVEKLGNQEPIRTATAWEGDQLRVTAKILNVRSGPGKNHPVIGQVNEGDLLFVRSPGSDWYYVQLPDKSFGWVMAVYTSRVYPKAMG